MNNEIALDYPPVWKMQNKNAYQYAIPGYAVIGSASRVTAEERDLKHLAPAARAVVEDGGERWQWHARVMADCRMLTCDFNGEKYEIPTQGIATTLAGAKLMVEAAVRATETIPPHTPKSEAA